MVHDVKCYLWKLAVFVHVERCHVLERDHASLRQTDARSESAGQRGRGAFTLNLSQGLENLPRRHAHLTEGLRSVGKLLTLCISTSFLYVVSGVDPGQ